MYASKTTSMADISRQIGLRCNTNASSSKNPLVLRKKAPDNIKTPMSIRKIWGEPSPRVSSVPRKIESRNRDNSVLSSAQKTTRGNFVYGNAKRDADNGAAHSKKTTYRQ